MAGAGGGARGGSGAPGEIRKLSEAVATMIAAGEVVQRPASALKEVLENALDAGASQVSVLAKDGGVKLLQVQDNGCGIRAEDLGILCHRHTTSKLREFDDLRQMRTLGFRGEALASVSFVSHLQVTTMTAGAESALRASYRDGELDDVGPQPCAGVPGTTITMKDLFYNLLARRKALRPPAEEYAKLLEVVSRYAVYKDGVAFSCRRQGAARPDVNVPARATRLDRIRTIYGPSVSRELTEFEAASEPGHCAGANDEAGGGLGGEGEREGREAFSFSSRGFISSVNYTAKRTTLILFINGRLVESSHLRRALEAAYATVMPKAAKPWVYLDIRLPLDHVDVNVHPTKKEVRFLHEEELIDALRGAVEARLVASNSTRTFVQKKLTPGGDGTQFASEENGGGGGGDPGAEKKTYYQPQKLVRTDAKATKLEAFMMPSKAPSTGGNKRGAVEAGLDSQGPLNVSRPQTLAPRQRVHADSNTSELTSVKDVLEGFSRQGHSQLAELFRQHTYIGVADERRIMLQHLTKLYLMDITVLSRDMFFQQIFRRFGSFDHLRLSNPASLEELALLAMEHGGGGEVGTQFDAAKGAAAARELAETLQTKAPMLDEYFGMSIDAEGRLCTLPQIIDGFVPDFERLPAFVLGLGGVDWSEERLCFEGVAAELASLYEMHPVVPPGPEVPESPTRAEQEARAKEVEQTIQNVLLPAMRLFLQPPAARATDGSALLVTTLERLYRVFERC